MRKNTASCSGYLSQTHSQPSRRVWSFLFFQFLFLRLSPVPFWYFLFFPLLVFAFRFLSLLFHVLFLRFSLQDFNQPKKRKSADSQQNFLWWSPSHPMSSKCQICTWLMLHVWGGDGWVRFWWSLHVSMNYIYALVISYIPYYILICSAFSRKSWQKSVEHAWQELTKNCQVAEPQSST